MSDISDINENTSVYEWPLKYKDLKDATDVYNLDIQKAYARGYSDGLDKAQKGRNAFDISYEEVFQNIQETCQCFGFIANIMMWPDEPDGFYIWFVDLKTGRCSEKTPMWKIGETNRKRFVSKIWQVANDLQMAIEDEQKEEEDMSVNDILKTLSENELLKGKKIKEWNIDVAYEDTDGEIKEFGIYS